MTKKKKLIIALIGVIIVGIGVSIFITVQNNKAEEARVQKELENKYYLQALALNLPTGIGQQAEYMPYNDRFSSLLYLDLAYYKKNTGKELTIQEIQEYLSQEFENDRSVRIYDNGMHPQIEEYIEWWIEPRQDEKIEEYVDSLIVILSEYTKKNYLDKGLESPFPAITDFTFGQYDELIKKEADPSYEMQFDFE